LRVQWAGHDREHQHRIDLRADASGDDRSGHALSHARRQVRRPGGAPGGLACALLGGGILLGLAFGLGSLSQVAAIAVYTVGLITMLSLSTAYNFAKARWRPLLRRFDHAGIFIMIAGSYTPFTTQNLHGWWAIGMTAAVWTVAGIGVLAKLFLPGLDKRFWVGAVPGPGLAGPGGHQADDRRHGLGGPAAFGDRRRDLFDRYGVLPDEAAEVPAGDLARSRDRRRRPALRRGAGRGGPDLERSPLTWRKLSWL
jgi:hypothetical protein